MSDLPAVTSSFTFKPVRSDIEIELMMNLASELSMPDIDSMEPNSYAVEYAAGVSATLEWLFDAAATEPLEEA